MDGTDNASALPVKVYRLIPIAAGEDADGLIAKFRVSLPDRPGSLAGFASAIASSGGNISFFHYDRSVDSGRVAVEVAIDGRTALDGLLASLRADRYGFPGDTPAQDEVQITSMESILEVTVRLENRPGTLAAFSGLLAAHGANVIGHRP